MATKIELTSGSLMAGNPVVFAVTAESLVPRATFHRIKLKVSAQLSTATAADDYIFTSPANNAEAVSIDISTALRAVSESYEHTALAQTTTYPFIVYTLMAWDEYMIDGIPYESVVRTYGSNVYALPGAFTDMERLIAGYTKETRKFTRKPSTGEFCAVGDLLCYPIAYDTPQTIMSTLTAGPTVQVQTVQLPLGAQTHNGHTIWVVPASRHRYQFQFVNSMGVIESISAGTYASFSTEKESEEFSLSRNTSFNVFNRHMRRVKQDRKVISLSSGPVNEAWHEWWTHEFLNATQIWIRLQNQWIPCTLECDDDMAGIDYAANALPHVRFKCKLNINGSFKLTL